MNTPRSIPHSIKRKVRQACGFGCAICGYPIFEYDHIIPFANVKEHKVSNLVCLCPTHHSEKTRRLLPIRIIRDARRNPYNINNKGKSTHPLYFFGDECLIKLGTVENYYKRTRGAKVYEYSPLVIENEELIKIRFDNDDFLYIDLTIRDEANEMAVSIVENELVFRRDFWDVEFIANRLIVKSAEREILFDAIFDMPSLVDIKRCLFRGKNSKLLLKSGFMSTRRGLLYSENRCVGVRYGLVYNSREDFWPSCVLIND